MKEVKQFRLTVLFGTTDATMTKQRVFDIVDAIFEPVNNRSHEYYISIEDVLAPEKQPEKRKSK